MIPALLFWLNRKYGNDFRKYFWQKAINSYSFLKRWIIPATVLLLFLLTILIARSQEKQLLYKVYRNDNQIGETKVIYSQDSTHCRIKAISDAKFRIIFSFALSVIEEVQLLNNLMIFSSMNRKLNGSEKINHQTWISGNSYFFNNSNRSIVSPYYPVNFHLLQLYIKEPVNVQRVYSENYQQFLELIKTGTHSYRLLIPGGDYTEFLYDHGLCSRVNMSYTFYSVTMILQH